MTANIDRDIFLTLPILIERLAEKFGEAPALIGEQDRLSYRGLAERSNRYARWALAQDLKAGDVVCLMMSNCPDYMAIWLGMTRVSVTVALVNTNLRGLSLAHSINLVSPKLVIVGADLIDAFAAARAQLSPELRCWVHGRRHPLPRIDDEISPMSGDRLGRAESRPPSVMQRALLLYTSGTTGLPKAANVSHFRLMQWSHWTAGMIDARASDRTYDCLPLYHSIGGVVAIGAMLVVGGSVVLRRRFTASRFWDDVVETDCTLFYYVGEFCRYLVNSPPQRRERDHRIRLCCGGGLGREVWIELQRRFRIPRVLEFYAATEGTFSLYNCEGKPGAIGRIPSFLAHRFPVALVKIDDDTGEPMRDPNGFCIRCSTNEIGEAIGRIAVDGMRPGIRFEGYTDRDDSQKKLLRDVFVERRCLASHRRSHAQGCERLFLFCRPHWRHFSLERRECVDNGGCRGDCCVFRGPRCGRIRRRGPRYGRPGRHGGNRRDERFRTGSVPSAPCRTDFPITPVLGSCASAARSKPPGH